MICRPSGHHQLSRVALGPEVKKAEQNLAVLDQLGDGLVVFHAVGLDEEVEGDTGLGLGVGLPDVVQVPFGLGLHGFRHRVQNIAGLLHPASLLAGAAEDLTQRRPEAQGTIAGGQFRGAGEAAALEVDQQLAPALRALALPVGKAEHLLAAPFVGADQVFDPPV